MHTLPRRLHQFEHIKAQSFGMMCCRLFVCPVSLLWKDLRDHWQMGDESTFPASTYIYDPKGCHNLPHSQGTLRHTVLRQHVLHVCTCMSAHAACAFFIHHVCTCMSADSTTVGRRWRCTVNLKQTRFGQSKPVAMLQLRILRYSSHLLLACLWNFS